MANKKMPRVPIVHVPATELAVDLARPPVSPFCSWGWRVGPKVGRWKKTTPRSSDACSKKRSENPRTTRAQPVRPPIPPSRFVDPFPFATPYLRPFVFPFFLLNSILPQRQPIWESVDGIKGLWLCRDFLSIQHQSLLLSAIERGGLFYFSRNIPLYIFFV